MHPLHFGSDLADIQIRIRINPDSNPISLLVDILALAKFVLSECSCISLHLCMS